MVQPLGDKPLLPERFSKRLEVREIRAGDPALELMPPPARIRQARFAQQAVCLGGFRDGRLIGYLWFCRGAYDEDEVRCTYVIAPENDSVFDFDFYIFPEYRMGVAFAALWQGAAEYLRARGVRHTFSRLTQFNLSSRRAHDHLGWRPVGRAIFVQLGPVELMAATLPPYLHVSLPSTRRVRLRLSIPTCPG
jgi:hypothetical protein